MKRCPACRQMFDPGKIRLYLPFCSERCSLIDLGAWLKEEHRIPADSNEPQDSVPPDGRDLH